MSEIKKPSVSLCMIVKDEIAHLEDCLDSVEHLVDEIVIVDTGSTDGTYDVVERRATRYLQIEWNGFAHARNVAQGLAEGDLILILDADETIADTTGWHLALEQMASGTCDGVAFVVHNQLPSEQVLASDRIWQLRMYANHRPEIQWVGTVHNQIANALTQHPINGVEAKFYQAQVLIEHKGYNLPKPVMMQKYKARMEALYKELEEATEEKVKSYYRFQTANAHFMQNEYDKCLEHVRECNFDKMTGENIYSTCLMAVHCCHILGVPEEGMTYAKRMIDTLPDESMSFLMMGLTYLSSGEFKAAYNFLGAAMAQTQMNGMQYKYMLDLHYIAAPAGEAALNLKRYGDAKHLFQMHLSKYPDNKRIAELEQAIIPVEQAKELEAQRAALSVEETVEVQDLRKVDSQSPSVESPA